MKQSGRVQFSARGREAEKALRRAVARVVEEHRVRRLPIAVMRNGKAIWVVPGRRRQTGPQPRRAAKA